MPPAKKRSAPSQSNTLLKFFNADGNATPSPVKTTKAPKFQTQTPSKARLSTGLSAEDAIVIDSDPVEQRERGGTSSKPLVVKPQEVEDSLSFGESALLRSSPPPLPSRDSDASINPVIEASPVTTPEATTIPDDELEKLGGIKLEDDEWCLGDDEIVEDNGDGYVDDGESEIKDEVMTSPATCEKACPLCGMSIEGMSNSVVDKHVNDCIDAASASASKENSKPQSTKTRTPAQARSTNVFSVLMSSHKENEAWKEASQAEGNFKPSKANGGRRKAPFYKVMPGMPIAVDAFRYGKIPGVEAYFLSHAHSDHYTNLSAAWKNGPIYCSVTTANLIVYMLGVDRKWLHPLKNDVETEIPNTNGVKVTLMEANHCPGSSLFVFEGRQTVNAGDSTFSSPYVGSKRIFRYLHCGDFRACPAHVLHPAVNGKRIDQVYLDTTYLNPKYCFPPQPLVINACAELARRLVNGEIVIPQGSDLETSKAQSIDQWVSPLAKSEPVDDVGGAGTSTMLQPVSAKPEKYLVVIGTYSIGKERIVKAVAKALKSKIYCDPRKTQILLCQDDTELHSMLTTDPLGATVHVVPLQVINSDRFADYVDRWGHFTKAIGFRPTGWTYTPPAGVDTLPSVAHVIARDQKRTFTCVNLKEMRNSTPSLKLYGVPYSEHSSFFELSCFALSLNWGKMIATVNVGSASSRDKMGKWFEKWEAERKKLGTVKDGNQMVGYRKLDYW